jgi:hypothetical protein
LPPLSVTAFTPLVSASWKLLLCAASAPRAISKLGKEPEGCATSSTHTQGRSIPGSMLFLEDNEWKGISQQRRGSIWTLHPEFVTDSSWSSFSASVYSFVK